MAGYGNEKEVHGKMCICFCGGKKASNQLWCDECFDKREVCPKCAAWKFSNNALCEKCFEEVK